MSHTPKRSDVRGSRKTGDTKDRYAVIKQQGMQNLSPGRYDVNEEAKKATQKSLSKSNEMKLNKADTGGTGTPVEINPEKSIVGQTFN